MAVNRELLFKAKCKDNGKWVIGSYAYIFAPDKECLVIGIHKENHWIIEENGNICIVDPSTICRCTGKEYMNGEAVYEGDIFESQACGLKMILKYGTYQAYCPEDKEYMDNVGFYAEAEGYAPMPIGDLSDYALKVGNIFDNPDLLEGREETD